MPNTQFKTVKLRVVNGPAVDWLLPDPTGCLRRGTIRLGVAASAPGKVKSVVFRDGVGRITRAKSVGAGLYAADWHAKNAKGATHRLFVVATAATGRTASARLTVRLCK